MTSSIVVGAGFGDEGKGRRVSALVSTGNPAKSLVIRFNGGHQAGHTVQKDGVRHVFSSFGSGTLHGAETFWSRFCTVYPHALLNEYDVLKPKLTCEMPILYLDPRCPITTPYDLLANQQDTLNTKVHGSVGTGFGKTLQREQDGFHLWVEDLLNPYIFDIKLEMIKRYYKSSTAVPEFQYAARALAMQPFIRICYLDWRFFIPAEHEHVIFEGAQGILLDQEYGFFPHVTRSNTSARNAFTIIRECHLDQEIDMFYVTRGYATRHGIGPFSDSHEADLHPNIVETNVLNTYQGEFRRAPINLQMFRYAMECCRKEEANHNIQTRSLTITGLDHMKTFSVVNEGKLIQCANYEELGEKLQYAARPLQFTYICNSFGPEGTMVL